MSCAECGGEVAAAELFCPACGALQPPDPTVDHFARLGLERRFEQDPEQVTAAHRALQRKLHPDRFVSRGEAAREHSLRHATALNDAVRILRDPVNRADYLLSLQGRDIAAEEGTLRLDPRFLMEVFELREAIGELSGKDAHVERGRIERDIAGRYEEKLLALGQGLDDPGERTTADLDRLAQLAAQLRYLKNILRELHAVE